MKGVEQNNMSPREYKFVSIKQYQKYYVMYLKIFLYYKS